MEPHIERPRAQAPCFQRLAERFHKLQGVARQGLRRADRLGEHPADLDEFWGFDRLDGLARASIGLVETAGQFGAEPERQGRARLGLDLADGVDAHLAQGVGHAFGQPQRPGRQVGDSPAALIARHDRRRGMDKPGQGMRRAPAASHGGPRAEAGGGQPADHVGEQGVLAAEQVRRAAGVDHQAGGRVGGDDWRVESQRPERQAVQCLGVALRIRVMGDELGAEGAGLSRGHARIEPDCLCGGVGGQHQPLAARSADHHDRDVSRRRVFAKAAPQAIGRPGRQVKRDDPSHRRLPIQNQRIRPPCSG